MRPRPYAELEKLTEDLPVAEVPAPAAGSLPARRLSGDPTSRFADRTDERLRPGRALGGAAPPHRAGFETGQA